MLTIKQTARHLASPLRPFIAGSTTALAPIARIQENLCSARARGQFAPVYRRRPAGLVKRLTRRITIVGRVLPSVGPMTGSARPPWQLDWDAWAWRKERPLPTLPFHAFFTTGTGMPGIFTLTDPIMVRLVKNSVFQSSPPKPILVVAGWPWTMRPSFLPFGSST